MRAIHPRLTGPSHPGILLLAAASFIALLLNGCFRGKDILAGEPAERQVRLTMPDGRQRTALLFVPKGTAPTQGWPLVVMLHGAGGSTRNVVRTTGWDRLAELERFVAVFPNGTPADETKPERFNGNPQTWNSGAGTSLASGEGSAGAKGVDDVGFIEELIKQVGQRTPIDSRRIYVAGHSNGAGMAYRFARERPKLVAAAGVMAGQLQEGMPRLPSPVSLISICGAKDPLAPLEGGEVPAAGAKARTRPMLHNVADWARADGLAEAPRTLRDDETLRVLQWGPDAAGTEVRWIVVKDNGHTWVGSPDPLPESIIGPKSKSLNATTTMWEFFKEHPKPPAETTR